MKIPFFIPIKVVDVKDLKVALCVGVVWDLQGVRIDLNMFIVRKISNNSDNFYKLCGTKRQKNRPMN